MAVLEAVDPQLARLVAAESARQHDTLCLIPSENHVSPAVLEASGSVLMNKYSEGYPAKRYYQGNALVDDIETLTAQRARQLFNAEHANVQPLSGAPANLAAYAAVLQPGDTVLGMALDAGGHLTHGHGVSVTGRWFNSVRYGVRRDTGTIDLDEVRELARTHRPKLIWCGGTAIPRTIDFEGFATIADEVGATLAADVAHIAGLIAAGVHPTPVGHAAVVTTTTHKTLRGPRGAMILTDAEHATAIDRAVFPGLQGGPHDHTTAAIAVALHEAAQPAFRTYAQAIVTNARALGEALRNRGFDLVSGGTDNHLLLADLTSKGVGGRPAAEGLEQAGLVCNYNAVPFDPRPPMDPSGIRVGTPAITTRGLTPTHMEDVARWIDEAVEATRKEDPGALDRIRGEVAELAREFPPPA
ncbi:serine hydroxymethyltransferase [Solirubrobacter soli]|uniref:serine hydroxymethyltransferase n=1 Tax=Solirubrobacter soli TaxID=363832 RepID=UPI0004265B44|nr:serine hydroxymethyltransferase [Solirubrobacter soli]